MLSSLFMAAFAVQTSEEGFSKLQIFMQQLIDWGVGAGGRIIGAILIFVVGRFLISFIKKLLSKLLMKRHIDAGIQSFIKSLVNILLTILLIIAVIGKLGVETTSFAALLASAGVAVGMALSGNLQNFAGGLIVLLFRPFKVGDWIESQGVSGTVREIQIFHTILTTADNKVIYIPNGALSSGTVTNFIAYAVMGIPSGILLQKVGYKKTALIAVAIGFIGVGVQFLSGHSSPEMAFAVYLIGAFIAGFSMCLLNTVVNPMLNKLGGEGNKGNQLIQIGGSFNSVMATITPMFVGILIAGSIEKATISQIFPVMYTAMAVFALAFLVLLFVPIPEPNAATTTEPIGKLMSGALKFRHFILGAIAIFVYVGIEVGVPGTLNLFLTDPVEKGGAGIASTISGFVVGTYWFLMLIGRLAGASLGAKVSSKAMLTFTSALGLLLVFLAIFSPTDSFVNLPVLQQSATGGLSFGLAEVPINAMYLVLVGLCTSIMWGGIFNLAVEGLGKYLAAASGLFMVLVCGGGILPVIQGVVADMAGFMASYWVIIAALAYLLFYGLIGCKNVNKDIKVD